MNTGLFDALEKRIENLLEHYNSLKQENSLLKEEKQRLLQEREGLKTRIDAIINKLEGF